jgi:hypothetical protein
MLHTVCTEHYLEATSEKSSDLKLRTMSCSNAEIATTIHVLSITSFIAKKVKFETSLKTINLLHVREINNKMISGLIL